MKAKSKIAKQTQKKTNMELVKTIVAAKKHESWTEVAKILSGSRKKRINKNIEDLDKKKENVVVPGKVLAQGEIDKKIKVVALDFSGKAKEKLLKAKCEVSSILEEIKSNPQAKGIEILKAKSEDFTLSKLNKKKNLNK